MLSPGCFADFWQSASRVLCLEGYVQGAGGCNHYPLGIWRRLLNTYLHHCWVLTKSLGSNGSLSVPSMMKKGRGEMLLLHVHMQNAPSNSQLGYQYCNAKVIEIGK